MRIRNIVSRVLLVHPVKKNNLVNNFDYNVSINHQDICEKFILNV